MRRIPGLERIVPRSRRLPGLERIVPQLRRLPGVKFPVRIQDPLFPVLRT